MTHDVKNANFEAIVASYHRGLVGAPLCLDDTGLSREQLIEKYNRFLKGGGHVPEATNVG
jgi:hypothetical protein